MLLEKTQVISSQKRINCHIEKTHFMRVLNPPAVISLLKVKYSLVNMNFKNIRKDII